MRLSPGGHCPSPVVRTVSKTAAVGSEVGIRIGYEYGRYVPGVKASIEPDEAACDQDVPATHDEPSQVATSAKQLRYYYTCLFQNSYD